MHRGSRLFLASLIALTIGLAAPASAAAPASPTNLSATSVSQSQINLTWVDNSANGSDSEDGFRVERATSVSGPWSQIAATAQNVTSYTSSSLSSGTTYSYRVLAFSNTKGNSAYTNTASATTLAPAPLPPSNLTASSVSASRIDLTWTDNATNESGYKIERAASASGPWSQIALAGAGVAFFSNTGLGASTPYYYRVKAYNSGGESGYSNTDSATTRDTIPTAPSNLSATALSTSQINLSWSDNSSHEWGFKIERATALTGPFKNIVLLGDGVTTFANTGLNASTTYYFRVYAFNAAGGSIYSIVASAATRASTSVPMAPSTLTATASSVSQINLTWIDSSNDETGFTVERATSPTGPFVQMGTVPTTSLIGANLLSFASTGLTPGTSYYFRVRAYNGIGNSAYSAISTARTLQNLIAPTAPIGPTATAVSSSQINVSWADNASNEAGFKVERAASPSGPWTQVALLGANVTGYSSTGLSPSTTYYFRLKAYNVVGDSPYSSTTSAVTQAGISLPGAPSGLTATAASSSQVNLTWADGSTNEAGFQVERATSSGGPFTLLATTGASATTFSNTGLASSTAYYYRVRATNTAGASAYSNTAGATTQAAAAPPSAPSALTATAASSSQINLTWADNSTNETGFKIERAVSSSGPWTQIATPGSNTVSYSNGGLSSSTTYYYRVRAYNATVDSAYSSTASATTSAASTGGGSELLSTRFGGSMGGSDYTDPKGVATDASGNIFTGGSFYGQADFGSGVSIASGGGYDGFVAKLSASGSALWAKRLGGSLTDFVYSVATDGAGNVLVAGEFQGTANFGCGNLSNPGGNNFDMFVVKLAGSNGSCLWSKSFGNTYRDVAYGVAVDDANNILLTGGFYDTVNFGGVSLSAHFSLNAAPDIFVLKLAGGDGHTIWAKGGFGSSSDDIGRSVAADAAGNVLVTGEFLLSADFGAPTQVLSNIDYPDVFVVKLDSAGNSLWAKQYGGNLDQRGTDIAVDGLNNVFVTGWFRGSIDLGGGGGGVTVPPGSSSTFLIKLTPGGATSWQKTIGDSDYLRYPSVAVDSANNVVLASQIKQIVDLGGGPLTSANTFRQDVLVAKYRPDGSFAWAKRFTGTNESAGADVALDGTNVVFTGWISGTVDFGGGALVNGTNGVRAGVAIKLGP